MNIVKSIHVNAVYHPVLIAISSLSKKRNIVQPIGAPNQLAMEWINVRNTPNNVVGRDVLLLSIKKAPLIFANNIVVMRKIA